MPRAIAGALTHSTAEPSRAQHSSPTPPSFIHLFSYSLSLDLATSLFQLPPLYLPRSTVCLPLSRSLSLSSSALPPPFHCLSSSLSTQKSPQTLPRSLLLDV